MHMDADFRNLDVPKMYDVLISLLEEQEKAKITYSVEDTRDETKTA
ncbi:MAG: hypothetical protein HFH11_11815 [Dorea sp.]|nr:hypothetical protein [Dorea sp.]